MYFLRWSTLWILSLDGQAQASHDALPQRQIPLILLVAGQLGVDELLAEQLVRGQGSQDPKFVFSEFEG